MKIIFAILFLMSSIAFVILGMRAMDSKEVSPTEDSGYTDIPPVSYTPFPDVLPQNGRDIRTLKNATPVGAGMWHFEGTPTNPDAGFSILYNERNNSFAIDLWRQPIAESRKAAGEYFREMLGVTESEACALNVYMGVTESVDGDYTRQNLSFEFCPNAIEL